MMIAKSGAIQPRRSLRKFLGGPKRAVGLVVEVRKLVAALTAVLQRCEEEFSAQNVGMALYGLKCQHDSPEARELVEALTCQVEFCSEEMTPT